MFRKFKKSFRNFLLRNDHSTSYFSQGGEDAILSKIFKGGSGFYVDIGAFHPYKHSNTYYFYLRGWRGINIDARPGSMELFKKLRKNDINLEIGVGAQKGTSTFYILDDSSTMNSFSKENLVNQGVLEFIKKEIQVSTDTLENILDKQSSSFTHIDFLNIDVEGYDLEVLMSNNWIKHRPSVIVVELDCTTLEDLEKNESAIFLNQQGYTIIAKNIIKKDLASVFFAENGFSY